MSIDQTPLENALEFVGWIRNNYERAARFTQHKDLWIALADEIDRLNKIVGPNYGKSPFITIAELGEISKAQGEAYHQTRPDDCKPEEKLPSHE